MYRKFKLSDALKPSVRKRSGVLEVRGAGGT